MSSESQNPQEEQKEQKEQKESAQGQQVDRPRETGVARARPLGLSPLIPFIQSPFSLMRRMMSDMERAFDELGGGAAGPSFAWSPQIDVFQRGEQLVIRADLPGLDKENVRLEVTGDGLLLSGERQEESEQREGGSYRRERTYGSFQRLIPLPENIDPESATAQMKNGVLEVGFKLSEQRPESRRIEISEGEKEGSTTIH